MGSSPPTLASNICVQKTTNSVFRAKTPELLQDTSQSCSRGNTVSSVQKGGQDKRRKLTLSSGTPSVFRRGKLSPGKGRPWILQRYSGEISPAGGWSLRLGMQQKKPLPEEKPRPKVTMTYMALRHVTLSML